MFSLLFYELPVFIKNHTCRQYVNPYFKEQHAKQDVGNRHCPFGHLW